MSYIKPFNEFQVNEASTVMFKTASKFLQKIEAKYKTLIVNQIKKKKKLSEKDIFNYMEDEMEDDNIAYIKQLLTSLVEEDVLTVDKKLNYSIKK